MRKPVLIGIAGGTGSGKSTVARAIFKSLPEKNISIIEQDAYYRDQSHLPLEERVKTNYDHPFAFDTDLLVDHDRVKMACVDGGLLNNQPIEKPSYDFTIHTREKTTHTVYPKDIIILEGILILEDERLRELMDIKIFVDTDPDLRVVRRIKRDIQDRGRTLDSVISQYIKTVKPAHDIFIEPTKKFADIIIPEGGFNKVAIDVMVATIKNRLTEIGE